MRVADYQNSANNERAHLYLDPPEAKALARAARLPPRKIQGYARPGVRIADIALDPR